MVLKCLRSLRVSPNVKILMKNDLMTAHLAKFMVLKNLLNAKMRFIEQNTLYRGNDLSITNCFFSGQRCDLYLLRTGSTEPGVYSIVPNKGTGTFINFRIFFQKVRAYLGGYVY